MTVGYDFTRHSHAVEGAREALGVLFAAETPRGVLDVGCGIWTWLAAAIDLGVGDVVGVDGAVAGEHAVMVPHEILRHIDLTQAWSLGRRFDAVLCLEVAEHLEAGHAPGLVEALAAHSDTIYFCAACPNQGGQHHVNCQWPDYWQQLFNARGYACSDTPRWLIWNNPRIEPWCRQNLFVATRSDAMSAGREPRIPAFVHPQIMQHIFLRDATLGRLPLRWLLGAACSGLAAKIGRLFRPASS
jgi:SAM-dependent methyltransferase